MILLAVMLLSMTVTVSAETTPYGYVSAENMVATYKENGWGIGTMRICVHQNRTYVKTDTGRDLAFKIEWKSADSTNNLVYFGDNGELAAVNATVYQFATGIAVIDGKPISEWMSDGAKIGISFDWSDNPNDRSFFELSVPSVIDANVTGKATALNRVKLNTHGLGAGTLWLRAYTSNTFEHLVYTDDGHVVQMGLSWTAESADEDWVEFGSGESMDILLGEFEFYGKPAKKYLGENDSFKLCFESSDGQRRWFEYTMGVAIGNTVYSSLNEAMAAAGEGQQIDLLGDYVTDDAAVLINAGVTLDLNGHEMTVAHLLSFGDVIDSTDGQGKLNMSNTAFLDLQKDNTAIALYDEDGYRFYNYTFLSKKRDTNTTDQVSYLMHLGFAQAKAYELLASNYGEGVELGIKIAITNGGVEMADICYAFRPNTVNTYVEQALADLETQQAIRLTVSGLDALEDFTISAQATVSTSTRMALVGEVMN